MADELRDWAPIRFTEGILAKHPAPRHPETGEALWESGIRLHGNQRAIMESRARFKQARGGWRAGKSFEAAVALHIDRLWRTRGGHTEDLYWVVGPTYDLAGEEMNHLHRLLDEVGVPHDFHTPKDDSWIISFPHTKTRIETRTGKEAMRIASKACRGIVLAEANQLSFDAFLNARGRVVQTRGWILIEGTFEHNAEGQWFWQIAEEWEKADGDGQSWPLPSWENLVNFPGGRQDPAILAEERSMSPEAFYEKFGGVATKSSKLALPQADSRWHVAQRYPRLGTSFEPEAPVYLFIDPGTAHAYSVFAAQVWASEGGTIVWVIDAVYRWDRETKQIIRECAQREWAGNVETAILDFASRQRRPEGPPVIQQWQEEWPLAAGHPLAVHAQPVPLHQGYEVHKRALLNGWPEGEAVKRWNRDGLLEQVTDPLGMRVMFDPKAAPPLFGGMVDGRYYRGEYNLHVKKTTKSGLVTSDEYLDQDNDGIKAMTYGLYGLQLTNRFQRYIRGGSAALQWQMVSRAG